MRKIAVVLAECDDNIFKNLVNEIVQLLKEQKYIYEAFSVYSLLELPSALAFIAASEHEYHGGIALGSTFETNDIIYQESIRGITEVSIQHMLPISYGILQKQGAPSDVVNNNNVAYDLVKSLANMIDLYDRFFRSNKNQ